MSKKSRSQRVNTSFLCKGTRSQRVATSQQRSVPSPGKFTSHPKLYCTHYSYIIASTTGQVPIRLKTAKRRRESAATLLQRRRNSARPSKCVRVRLRMQQACAMLCLARASPRRRRSVPSRTRKSPLKGDSIPGFIAK
jgi:hypothetical protein